MNQLNKFFEIKAFVADFVTWIKKTIHFDNSQSTSVFYF
ncbi:hypothetical protein Bcell_0215 [Evansella cellulosilytica DSM 2522]|uniref:Uncharacterized protein n=1 Tax=Evansella cellulosilytica (strain ATCC 21833 / DSM 2522 / FERM P-1141 / JCM 9156 / N-4) TaxID=649639 RepID=E6TU43_EVAC2|nr:hypothetical protein Bcell_0215 [Evansella cellulosilytica DSM 2522]